MSRELAELAREGYPIVCTEPTSALCLKHEYPMILNHPDVEVVASQVVDAGAYLEGCTGGKLKTDFRPLDLDVAYHTPCHLKALECGTPLADLLSLIPQLRLHRIEKGCSGMAGAYGLTERNFRTSIRIGWGLITRDARSRLDLGVTECSGCKFQMEQGTDDADGSSAQAAGLRVRTDARNRKQTAADQAETGGLMKVEVRLFARARDAAGAERVTVELPAGARVVDLRAALAADFPNLRPLAPSLLVAVGTDYADDRVALVAKVGNRLLSAGERRITYDAALTDDPIDYAALTESVRSTDSGAVVLFLGTVREMTDGRRTIALDYEAFGPMAEAKLARD